MTANILVFAAIGGLVATNSSSSGAKLSSPGVAGSGDLEVSNPLDELSAADIAVNIARVANLPESTSVNNKADSENAKLAVASSDDNIITKPQIISDGLKSNKDIIHYKTVEGDTVASLAEKFGITSETIRLSNNLGSDELTVGVNLLISPINGLIYRVQPGDTPASLAGKYQANLEQLVAFNDVELTGKFKQGDLIVIPNGQKPPEPRYNYANFSFGGNGYDHGWCTYYAAARSGAPGGWGNAESWDELAPLSGWTVSNVPRPGAIAQSSNGWAGHVGIVEDVRIVGGQYKIKYSDMNGLAGFNSVGYSGWVPAVGQFQKFIYH